MTSSAQESSSAGVLSAAQLHDFGAALLRSLSVPDEHADIVMASLVGANLRGVDSHGMQMLVVYLQQLRAGGVDPRATGRVAHANGACLRYDGDNALGQVVAQRCSDLVIAKAAEHGVAVVTAHHSNHFGTGAWWGERIAREGYLALVFSNACPVVAPWQGITPILGTNPLCMAVPAEMPGAGWLLDMATTTAALGKVADAKNRGEKTIPLAWGFRDEQGQPTSDPAAAQRGTPTPLGGFKGTGLAMMVELLSAGLSGGAMATELPAYTDGSETLGISHTFIAIDPRRFGVAETFAPRAARLSGMVKASQPSPGHHEILVAGEPEWRCACTRQESGIPLPRTLWEELMVWARELAVQPPAIKEDA